MKKYILLFISIWIAFIHVFASIEASEKLYQPYPIIFVHGIDPGNWGSWQNTRENLNQYFYSDETGYKYFHKNRNEYFPYCDYSFQNNGSIPDIATHFLTGSIKLALKSFPSEVPENERKVIIVAHSMGGLVTRSLLKQDLSGYYASKIDKVIFIGTPHLGAPGASAVWILNKVYREILIPMTRDYVEFYSQSVGSRRVFTDESSTMTVEGLIYDRLSSKIQTYRNDLNWDLGVFNMGGPDPNGIALEQLRLSGDVRYYKIFENAYNNKKQNITIDLSIIGANTFLGKSGLYLSEPGKYSSILGNFNYQEGGFLPSAWEINKLRKKYEPDFKFFPTFEGRVQSISNALRDGDGIVTTQSQLGIKGSYIPVTAHHTQETEQYQPILQAIDDKPPQVESIRVIARDARENNLATPHYVIFKIKEYLLADLEVLSLTLDGANVFPGGGSGGGYNPTYKYGDDFQSAEPYKPYDAYPEKGFLKERDDPNATVMDMNGTTTRLRLYPGEFYITVNLAYGKHEIKIKLKNPADKQTDELVYYVSMPKIYNLYNTTTYYLVSGDGTRHPEEVNHGYINVAPLQPTEHPDDAWIDTQTKISFSIADELFNKFKVDVWIYDRYGRTLIRKLYQQPVTLSGSAGSYQGDFQTFCAWDGRDDHNRDVPDQSYYKVKVIATPVDDSYILPQSDPPHLKQCLVATSQDYPNQDLIYADPSFVQASREPQDLELISENEKSFYEDKLYAGAPPNTIIDITDLSNQELTCKIQVPFPNSLVRADVPIFGLACGKDFKQYRLEYGESLNPTTWKQILTSTKPHVDTRLIKEIASAGATIRGNLGTWDTGLTEYEHNNKKHRADLNGLYTLKLTVTDTHGNIKEDRVTVRVGRVISFAFGGKATSPDGKVELMIPEHSIKNSFEVMGISEVNDASIKEKRGLKSKAYKIVPGEYFTEPAALKIKLDNDYKGNPGGLKICAFDMAKGERFLLPTEVDLKDNAICANVNYLSSSYCYAAVEVKDELTSMYPERLELPDYEIALTKEPFDMRKQPVVTFDYKCDPDAKPDLIAKVGKRYYDIQIKDDPKTYLKNNLKKAGKIDGFIADGKTHNIKIDLYAFLSKFSSTTTVEELMLADLDASGYMDLHPGRSNLKGSVSVENIRVEKRSGLNRLAVRSKDPSWSIGIYDGDPTEFELENNADKNYSIGAPFDKFNRAITPDVPVSNINFNLTRAQSKGSYILTLGAISADTSKKGYVRFKVLLNGKPLETLQASNWAGQLFQIPVRDGLKKGENTFTLQWLAGGSWVTWDYISFQQL